MAARRSLRATVGAVMAAVVAMITGCAQLPFTDGSFEKKIPAAIEQASFPVQKAWADKGTDGLTTYLAVGVTLAQDEFTAEDLREMLKIVAANNTINATQFRIYVRDPDDDSIDLTPLFTQLGVQNLLGYGDTINAEDLERVTSSG
ncbi:hypothetical protein [Microbacterium sp. CIAB417]|uniref:hypothetical protein n=1 Tax=Microbacterium sp. CIAB417 TaxID=2860287 RepID=UPI001FAD42BA|nr:hypothetical protein [Microbacterium sp. CIAB417]